MKSLTSKNQGGVLQSPHPMNPTPQEGVAKTPRTDSMLLSKGQPMASYTALADFARTLERELTASLEREATYKANAESFIGRLKNAQKELVLHQQKLAMTEEREKKLRGALDEQTARIEWAIQHGYINNELGWWSETAKEARALLFTQGGPTT